MLRVVETAGDRSPVASDALAGLAAAAASGDPQATRTLVASVTPAILRTSRGVLGVSDPEVEDVSQDAAIGFVRALPTFRGECSVLHLACRVAVFTALVAKRRRRSRGAGLVDPLDEQQVSRASSPAENLLATRRRAVLRDLCDELPQPQAEAVVMHFMLGFTIEETAAAADVPVNTVRSRLRLAKEALRERIALDPALRETLEVMP
jgi:RNA polymerase sigma factor (sigma-70 family)